MPKFVNDPQPNVWRAGKIEWQEPEKPPRPSKRDKKKVPSAKKV